MKKKKVPLKPLGMIVAGAASGALLATNYLTPAIAQTVTHTGSGATIKTYKTATLPRTYVATDFLEYGNLARTAQIFQQFGCDIDTNTVIPLQDIVDSASSGNLVYIGFDQTIPGRIGDISEAVSTMIGNGVNVQIAYPDSLNRAERASVYVVRGGLIDTLDCMSSLCSQGPVFCYDQSEFNVFSIVPSDSNGYVAFIAETSDSSLSIGVIHNDGIEGILGFTKIRPTNVLSREAYARYLGSVLECYGYTPDSIDDEPILPNSLSIPVNYPNPFNSFTNIVYNLDSPSMVRLDIFNIQGQYVATLYNDFADRGSHTIQWEPDGLASDVYLLRMVHKPISHRGEVNTTIRPMTLKMTLVK